MEFYQHLYHQHLMNPYISGQIPTQGPGGAAERDKHGAHAERFPQWTHGETKELFAMRAELDQSFAETKRNKQLWEAISTGLRRKGFHRTPDQCKSKWKNLVTRFKGSETMEGEDVYRQFPFYEDMRKICSDRIERQRSATDDKKGKGEGREVQVQAEGSKEETEAEAEEEEEEEEEEKVAGSSSRKRRRVEIRSKTSCAAEEEVESALREFARRHLETEMRRLEEAEAREAERKAEEEEWRKEMECLHLVRMDLERRWREEEEARRARAEARAERRHAVFMALLDRLAEKCL